MLALFAVLVNWTGSFWIAAVFAAGLGFSASPLIVLSNTLINEAIPSEVEGKVFSSLDLVIHLPLLVFMFITAQMAEHVSKTGIMTVVGFCLALLGIAGLSQRAIFKKEVLKCEGQK
jgi:MFS family permease